MDDIRRMEEETQRELDQVCVSVETMQHSSAHKKTLPVLFHVSLFFRCVAKGLCEG